MKQRHSKNRPSQLLTYLGIGKKPSTRNRRPLIGVIEGCGVGPQVVQGSLRVLSAVEQVTGVKFELRHGGPVGEVAEQRFGSSFPECTANFFAEIFAEGGAILNGAGGGRFVYELRERFNLFCKFAPIRPWSQLTPALPVSKGNLSRVDMLVVRDNAGGVYQGKWNTIQSAAGKIAEHSFSYTESQVRQLAEVAARAAAARSGKMHVIVKDGGVPAISALWREVSVAVAKQHGVQTFFMNIDLAAYEFIHNPAQFDVVFTPNLFGDILVDIAGALLGSRGVTFSGNFDPAGHGVYQTNHGCAHDLADEDVANPAGQILSLAMLLRESFGLDEAATLMEDALVETWEQKLRTADLAEPGCQVVGNKAMSEHIAQQVLRLAEKRSSHEASAAVD